MCTCELYGWCDVCRGGDDGAEQSASSSSLPASPTETSNLDREDNETLANEQA
jgi:hypothetical protein